MARFVAGAVFGVVVAVLGGAALGIHAEDDDVALAAEEAGVDETDLRGALNTTGLDPHEYLYMTGELARPLSAAMERRLACIAWYESHNTPSAVNRYSGAQGMYQFLPSTWRTTPQGRRGESAFNPDSARAATIWMLEQGRAREWVPVQRGLC